MKTLTQNLAVPQEEISNSNKYNIIFLGISLVTWACVPIFGIFPLLLSVQLNLLTSKNPSKNIKLLNNIVLILVVFTVCIFFTSYRIYSDLVVYLETYEQLNKLSPFEAALSYGTGIEFIPLLFAYLVYYLTNGSVYGYLFSHAFIINTLVVFVISKRLSAKYYPALLMLVFSTPYYYWQVPIIRHSLSNTFLMAAITFIESSGSSFLFYLILAFFCHSSNMINIFILSLIKISQRVKYNIVIRYLLKNKAIIIIIFFAVIVFSFTYKISLSTILPLISPFIDTNKYSSLENRMQSYDNYYVKSGFSLNTIIFTFIQIHVLFILFLKRDIPLKNLALIVIFLIQYISYIYSLINPTNWRVYFLLVSMYGILYIPNVRYLFVKNNLLLNMTLIGSVFVIFAFNCYIFFGGLAQGWVVAPEHIFFNGIPLQMTLPDYIIFFVNATPN